jgi:hypothetical protein
MSNNAESTLNRVLVALNLKEDKADKKEIKVDLEQKKTEDGQATFDAESFEVGSAVFVVTPDGNIPAPKGGYQMEDNTLVFVDESGYIVDIQEVVEEYEVENQNAPMKEEIGKPVAEEMTKPKKLTESVIKTTEFSADAFNELKKEIEAMKLSFSVMTDENAELKKALESTEGPRTTHSPEKGMARKAEFQFGKNRIETTQDRVFKSLFN